MWISGTDAVKQDLDGRQEAGHRSQSTGPDAPWSTLRYSSPSPMAVPKQKQSHSRTSKRRAQHKISAPTYNACPTCHSPRLPHRVCPTCGSYGGREVVHVHDHEHDHEH
jgi:large subunit ribosomal protein L32